MSFKSKNKNHIVKVIEVYDHVCQLLLAKIILTKYKHNLGGNSCIPLLIYSKLSLKNEVNVDAIFVSMLISL